MFDARLCSTFMSVEAREVWELWEVLEVLEVWCDHAAFNMAHSWLCGGLNMHCAALTMLPAAAATLLPSPPAPLLFLWLLLPP